MAEGRITEGHKASSGSNENILKLWRWPYNSVNILKNRELYTSDR